MDSIKLDLRFIATSEQELSKGLMHSQPLKEKEAALFIFNNFEKRCFWNKNVDFPIELFFLNKDGIIVDILDLDKQQEESVCSRAKYVVECKKNTSNENNIKIGDLFLIHSNAIYVLKKGSI